MFVVLIADRFDPDHRYWVRRQTLEEAKKVAWQYRKDNSHNTEIYELGSELS